MNSPGVCQSFCVKREIRHQYRIVAIPLDRSIPYSTIIEPLKTIALGALGNDRRGLCISSKTFQTYTELVTLKEAFNWENRLMPTTSSHMKAMAVDEFGNSDKLTLHILPVPTVDAGEVLIRINEEQR